MKAITAVGWIIVLGLVALNECNKHFLISDGSDSKVAQYIGALIQDANAKKPFEIHDVVILRYETAGKSDLFGDIVKEIPTMNPKTLPQPGKSHVNSPIRKASFVIIVSDAHEGVNLVLCFLIISELIIVLSVVNRGNFTTNSIAFMAQVSGQTAQSLSLFPLKLPHSIASKSFNAFTP